MRCFVFGCKNGDKKRLEGVTFHKIPQNRKVEWLQAIGRDPNTFIVNQKVCSEHFHTNDFFAGYGQRKLLKPNVIPIVKLQVDPDDARQGQAARTAVEHCTVDIEYDMEHEIPIKKSRRHLSFNLEENGLNSKQDLVHSDKFSRHPSASSNTSISSTSSASLKRKRQFVKSIHNYSLSPGNYKKQISWQLRRADNYKQRLKSAKRISRRRKENINHLKEIVTDLQKKNFLSSSALEQLKGCFSAIPQALMRRMLKKHHSSKLTREEYPPELKKFAMTLQFYSDKAYRYVRKVFNLSLPAESTIRAWLAKIDCEPGFTQPSLAAIKLKSGEFFEKNKKPLLFTLLLDEVSIKKDVSVEPTTLKSRGYIDFGCDIENEGEDCELATEALVLMVVGVNDNFKIPIAYFFVNKLNGMEKANIVREALRQLHATGAQILAVTCDGPKAHFAMMKDLGCQVRNMNNIVHYFKHPVDNTDVFVFFDVCHMLKLIRNNWAKLIQFKDPDGGIIDWTFITNLHDIQESEGFLLGNKLRKKHIEFNKAIMKVNLAAQTLSSSVADALEFLSRDLNLPLSECGTHIKIYSFS